MNSDTSWTLVLHETARRNDSSGRRSLPHAVRLLLLGLLLLAANPATARTIQHHISAANLTIIQNDVGNTTNSVTVIPTLSINDLEVRPGSVKAIYNIQVGPDPSDDVTNGLVMTASTEDGRNNGNGFYYQMTAFGTNAGAYSIFNYDTTASRARNNGNCAVAYFPYTNFLCGWGRNSRATNGGATDLFTSSAGIRLGTQFKSAGGGVFSLDLRSLGVNSTTDGILLVNHAKDEGNFALARANADGTWSLWVKDNHGDAAAYEQDPIAFVFVPRTNNTLISGKFMADASIAMYSGSTPQFSVSVVDVGTYRLTAPGYSPTNAVLITSPEGGQSLNQDNIVDYTPDGDGWLIYTRDINASDVPVLETPTGQLVASFVLIPGPTPNISVTPTNGLNTSENGTADHFVVSLDYPPIADVTISVSSSNPAEGVAAPATLTFTTNNWNVPQTVTVTGVDDNVVDGPQPYTILLAPAVSDDPAYSGLDPADVSAINADNDQAGISVVPTTGLVTSEAGASATFAVHLNSKPSASVTIGLSSSKPGEGLPSPTSLTFTTNNYATDQVVTVTGVDDFVVDGNVNYTIITAPAVSADLHYNGLDAADVACVNLDNDVASVRLSAASQITMKEGQSTNYTVVLSSSPTAPVTLNFTSSNPLKGSLSPAQVSFTSANWNVPQTLTLTAVDNSISDGDFNYTISGAATSADPLYSGISVLTISGTTVDNEAPIIYPVSAANVNVVQNDTGNTTNSVTATTTLSINDMRIRPGSIRGIYNLQVGVYASDDTTNGLIVSAITENGRDNGDGTFTYDMPAIAGSFDAVNPGYSVVTYDTTASRARENASFAVAYFTYSDWICGWGRNSTAINGGPTDFFTGSRGLSLGNQFVSYGGGVFTLDLRGMGYNSTTDGVLIVNHGKDEGNFALSTANTNGTWNLWVKDNHGDAAAYEQDPIAFVFVPRTNNTVISGKFMSDASIAMYNGASPQFAISNIDVGTYRLTIPGYNPTNGVLITSCEGGQSINQDNIINYTADGDGWLIYSRDINASALPTLETPTDTSVTPPQIQPVASFVFIPGPKPGFTVSPTNGLNTSESGTSDHFTVTLNYPPGADVTIALASSNPGEGVVSPASLTFTTNNWNVPQTVTVTGVDDNVVDGPQPYTIILAPVVSDDPAYSGLDPADVAVVNADNDQAGIAVAPSSGLVTTEAGGSATFAVHLNSKPSAPVTIGLISSKPGEGLPSPTSLTFTPANYSSNQVVTVTGVDDFVVDGTVAYNIIPAPAVSADAHYNGLQATNVACVNLDNDVAGITVTAGAAISLVEGQSGTYTVVLGSSPVANVLVHTTSSNPAKGSISPAILTFNSANWNVPQTVQVTAPDNYINDGDVAYVISTTVTSTDPVYNGFYLPTIAATTIDNEAALNLPSGDCIYGLGAPAVFLDAQAVVTDSANGSYPGGALTVTLTQNATAGDVLAIKNTGTGTGQIGVSGTNVTYGKNTIGILSGGVSMYPLIVQLNNLATPAAVQALVQNVTFQTAVGNVAPVSRTATVALYNGLGGISSASKVIRLGLLRDIQFQDGLDYGYGVYNSERDISLAQANSSQPQPSGTAADGLLIDWPDGGVANESQVLLRFDDIIGTNYNQIPPGSVIVSAQLMLTMINPGQGGTLNRMLTSWDSTNATWYNVGGGILKDDNQASSTYDSQIGNQIGTGTTALGTINVGVTIDVQDWASGIANYGWVMSGWPFNTDGTGFYPAEASSKANRPRLHVLWLPPGEAGVSFRQGVNGYTNAYDTKIQPSSPDLDASQATTVFVDYLSLTNGDTEQVLLRFDNLVGGTTNQVPPGAQVDAAILDLASVTANSMGDGGLFYPMLVPWTDTNATWNFFNNGIQPDGVKASTVSNVQAGTPDFAALVQSGFNSYNVTADVRAWINGSQTNYGWVVIPWLNGSDGWGFNTAEAAIPRERPQLRIYYSFPPVAAAVLQPLALAGGQKVIRFTGSPAKTYSIQRATSLAGVWATIGTATVAEDGTASYTDSSLSADSVFYRVVYQN